MDCLEYVIKNIPKDIKKDVEDNIINGNFVNKQCLDVKDKVVFTLGFHIGLAELVDEYGTLKTDEYSDDKRFSRFLPLFDENLHIIYKL